MLLLRSHLLPSHFTIRTRHEVLSWLVALADDSDKLTSWLLRLFECYLIVVWQVSIKHQTLHAFWRVKIEGTNETTFDEELPLLITDETKEQQDGKTEYLVQNQPDKEQTSNRMDGHCKGKQAPILLELSDTQGNDRAGA